MGVVEDTVHEFKTAKPPEKTMIIIVGIVIVGVAAYWFMRSRSQGALGAGAPTAGNQSGIQTIPAGSIPILPPGVNPIYNPGGGGVVAYGPTPGAGQGSNLATIRAKGTGPQAYDSTNPGIPLRSTPGGAIIGLIPFGTQVSITGTGITGGDNALGNTLWFPTSGGYISAYDIPGYQPPQQGGGPFGTAVAARGRKIAPTLEGHSYVARQYNGRRRIS